SRIDDAIGFVVKQGGHIFYYLVFPTADKTWVFDKQTELWVEDMWQDSEGVEHRSRLACATRAYGLNVGLDWQTGALLKIDQDAVTDLGQPIVRRRSFPHIVSNGNRVSYSSFSADMQAGEVSGPNSEIFLRYSDDRGRTWSNPISQ